MVEDDSALHHQPTATEQSSTQTTLSHDNNSYHLQGFLKDLIDMLSEDLEFNYDFRINEKYGTKEQDTGNWTGMIGKLVNQVFMEQQVQIQS